MDKALRVVVTGAAGQIGYAVLTNLANGVVFGETTPIILHLLDIEPAMTALSGVVLELEDCCFPNLLGIVATHKTDEAFKNVDFALMIGSMPRKDGMERSDLLKANVKIFKEQGTALNNFAKKTVKVVVVGNPANTNCYILMKYAPNIPKENFSALTRLDQNRAIFQIAKKVGVTCRDVKNVPIWGNHSGTQYPDFHNGVVKTPDGKTSKVVDVIKDEKWLKEDFIKTVQTRGGAVIAARKLSSALSAAKAVCDHCRDWHKGSTDWVSMAIYSDGSYGAPKDVFFSFPLTIKNGKWSIVQGLTLNDFSKAKIEATGKELESEKKDAIETCK